MILTILQKIEIILMRIRSQMGDRYEIIKKGFCCSIGCHDNNE